MPETDRLRPYTVGGVPSLPGSERRYIADELQRVSQAIGSTVEVLTSIEADVTSIEADVAPITSAWVQPDASWQTFSYVNSWVDYGAPFSPTGYRKLSNGMVVLRGLVKNGVATTIATLPAGYRPGLQGLFCVQTSPNIACRIDITTAGVISHQGGSSAWIALDGIAFLAEL